MKNQIKPLYLLLLISIGLFVTNGCSYISSINDLFGVWEVTNTECKKNCFLNLNLTLLLLTE